MVGTARKTQAWRAGPGRRAASVLAFELPTRWPVRCTEYSLPAPACGTASGAASRAGHRRSSRQRRVRRGHCGLPAGGPRRLRRCLVGPSASWGCAHPSHRPRWAVSDWRASRAGCAVPSWRCCPEAALRQAQRARDLAARTAARKVHARQRRHAIGRAAEHLADGRQPVEARRKSCTLSKRSSLFWPSPAQSPTAHARAPARQLAQRRRRGLANGDEQRQRIVALKRQPSR